MDRDAVIEALRARRDDLRRLGVARAALFGSVARGDAGPGSDIDILVELDPDARLGVFEYVGIAQFLADMLPGKVDVANRGGLKPSIKAEIEREAVYAF
jgi:predicted nucleotidyltransferase